MLYLSAHAGARVRERSRFPVRAGRTDAGEIIRGCGHESSEPEPPGFDYPLDEGDVTGHPLGPSLFDVGRRKGFDSYRETWKEPELPTEMDRTRAITSAGIELLVESGAQSQRPPLFLWLHYVNPHAPYSPPPPYDTAFLDAAARGGPALPVVPDYHGGIPKRWAVAGQRRLGYYVAQYDGEIATVDAEVGRVLEALEGSGLAGRTVVMLTSDLASMIAGARKQLDDLKAATA